MALLQSGMKSMHEYLIEKSYLVPDYQREYSWTTDENLEDMWQDLESSLEERRSHFLAKL